MPYTHSGKAPVVLRGDPVDPDGTDWVFFTYDDWLRTGETITTHEALIVGGTLETDSTYLGAWTDDDGTEYTEAYAVQFTPDADASQVEITHRVSTSTIGAVSLSRENIDKTAVIPVRTL